MKFKIRGYLSGFSGSFFACQTIFMTSSSKEEIIYAKDENQALRCKTVQDNRWWENHAPQGVPQSHTHQKDQGAQTPIAQ